MGSLKLKRILVSGDLNPRALNPNTLNPFREIASSGSLICPGSSIAGNLDTLGSLRA